MVRLMYALALLGLLLQESPRSIATAGQPRFSSSRVLLLRSSALPPGYRYRGYFVQQSVNGWDNNIPPIVAIDRRNGWLEAAEEKALDPTKHDVFLSVQLFRTPQGARTDFSLFFTNENPETRFEPGTSWLGATTIRRLGDIGTLYHISDESSRCPRHLTAGVSFVYGNGIFSTGVCTKTVGDAGAKDLARRLLSRARQVAGH